MNYCSTTASSPSKETIMQTHNQTMNRTGKQTSDEVTQLRQQLSALVKEVRCTIAHPARPEGLREVLAQSQEMLR
jgi:hypothetical protein